MRKRIYVYSKVGGRRTRRRAAAYAQPYILVLWATHIGRYAIKHRSPSSASERASDDCKSFRDTLAAGGSLPLPTRSAPPPTRSSLSSSQPPPCQSRTPTMRTLLRPPAISLFSTLPPRLFFSPKYPRALVRAFSSGKNSRQAKSSPRYLAPTNL